MANTGKSRWFISGSILVLGGLVLYSISIPPDPVIKTSPDHRKDRPHNVPAEDDLQLLTELHRSGKLSRDDRHLILQLKGDHSLGPNLQDLIKEIQENPASENRPQPRDLLMNSDFPGGDLDTTLNSSLDYTKNLTDTSVGFQTKKVLNSKHTHTDHSSTNLNEIGEDLARKELLSGLVPNIVHYIWCGKEFFKFRNYLGILSTIRALQPDKVILHYEYKPDPDMIFYYQWIDNLKHDFPFFQMEPLNDAQVKFCEGTKVERMAVIQGLLVRDGGFFLGENTWMLKYPTPRRSRDFETALSIGRTEGFLLLRGNLPVANPSEESLLANTSLKTAQTTCATVTQLRLMRGQPDCLVVSGGWLDDLYPMHIWELDNKFGRVARTIFYGYPEIKWPKPSFNELVPNIAHMVWIGGGRMDFVFYLGVLSLLYVVNVDNLYIHGDLPPAGPYWDKLKDHERVHFITRPIPDIVYQGQIQDYYRALMSDIIRVDVMIKYGGIYTDTDAIWVKPLSQEDRGYDAVAAFDWVDWSLPYPDTVNFGVSYGKRNAPFWRIFRDSMRTLHNDVHGFTGVMMPYKLLERYPHLLRIDCRLQVICYQFQCHPTWVEDYHNETNTHVTTNSIPNWRQDVNAFHWTHPNPQEFQNQETLLNSTGMFAEIGQMVLKKAGII